VQRWHKDSHILPFTDLTRQDTHGGQSRVPAKFQATVSSDVRIEDTRYTSLVEETDALNNNNSLQTFS
jgi:hypothetical protein